MNSVEEKILAAARYKLNVDEKVSSEHTGINPKHQEMTKFVPLL